MATLAERLERGEAAADEKVAALRQRLERLEAASSFREGLLRGVALRSRSGRAANPSQGRAPRLPEPAVPEPAGEPGGTPRAARFGGTYRQALATDPPTLDPVRVEDTTSFSVGIQIMEGLLEFDEDLELTPVIARRWTVSADQRTYRFDLHQGVRFHHGREVVATDFVYSFGRNLDPTALGVRAYIFDRILGYPLFAALRRAGAAAGKHAAGEEVDWAPLDEARELLEHVDRAFVEYRQHPDPDVVVELAGRLAALVRAKGGPVAEARTLATRVEGLSSWDFLRRGLRAEGDYSFVVELAKPFAPFLWNLSMVNAAVVPREEVERLGEDFATNPVGSGPFRFVKWDRDVVLELEAFEDYFRGRPFLDGLEYRIIPDPVTRLVEYEVGNLESVFRVPDEKYAAIKDDPPGVFREYPLLHVFYLGMNPQRPPFDDVRVRRAFNHAVNKRLIIEKIRKGRGEVAKGPLPPSFKAYDEGLEGYEYSPAKARALLAEAGYGPDNPLMDVPLWFNTATGSDANAKIAEVVQADLREVGVELELHGLAWGTYLDLVHRCEPPFYRLAWLPSHPNGDSILFPLFRSGSASNASCYSNPEVDALLEEARGLYDDGPRIDLYRRAQRKIVEDAVWIPVYHATEDFLHRDYVRDVPLNARGADAVRYRDVWLDPATRP